MSRRSQLRPFAAVVVLASSAVAQSTFLEVEPNETKAHAAANGVLTLVAGDRLQGATIGSSTSAPGAASADTWRVRTGALPAGIYRHTLTLTTSGAAGHTCTIRGLNQTSGAGLPGTPGTVDVAFQTSSSFAPQPRAVSWYGFGRGEELYYRVAGAPTTTADYVATLSTAAVTPVVVPGVFAPGVITLSTVGQTSLDTDIHLFDGSLTVIDDASNDDESVAEGGTGATTQSQMQRDLPAGVYFLAIGRFNVATNDNSPATEDYRTGNVLDFADSIASSSATLGPADFDLRISDSLGDVLVANASAAGERYQITFVQFTVGSAGPVSYCSAGVSTHACTATISANDNPSATFANACDITVANVEGAKSGLVFYGVSGPNAGLWNGASVLCVKAPTQRTGAQSSGGTSGLCDGSLALDWNAYQQTHPFALGHPWSPGDRVWVQGWYRDPPAGKTTNLSDAIELTYQP